jgi:hypothetical protein
MEESRLYAHELCTFTHLTLIPCLGLPLLKTATYSTDEIYIIVQ